MANARELAAIVRRENVDLLHARSRAPAWSTLAAARATKRPFITTYHGAYAEKGPLKRAYNSVMARGDIVIANSAYTASLIRSRYGTPGDKIRIIHRGVDPAVFDAASIAPARLDALRAAWGIAPGQQVILQAARLTRWKGQTVLIDALAKLGQSGMADWVCMFAGDDQGRTGYRAELERTARSVGLADRIRFAGHVDDMPAAFALATVTVIASTDPEAFGRTAIESQMMGTPVIATNIGAPPETVLSPADPAGMARTGWLIPPGDADALAAAITQALNLTPEQSAAISARAKQRAARDFSLAAMKRATLATYDELLRTQLAAAFS
jgi:glycosyltransferase involved in cell wall biosynthesis